MNSSRHLLRSAVREKWSTLIKSGAILSDPAQLRAVSIMDSTLDDLKAHKSKSGRVGLSSFDLSSMRGRDDADGVHDEVAHYTRNLAAENKRLLELQKSKRLGQKLTPQPIPKVEPTRVFQSVYSRATTAATNAPQTIPELDHHSQQTKGLYLFGSVGRGKTVLMNIVSDLLRSEQNLRVKRIHFFDFMKSIHFRMGSMETIPDIANEIADSIDVLLIDELAISDVQDASILPSLLEILLKRQVAVVVTSNQHPQSLYPNGLNRHIYLPPLLKELRKGVRLVSLDNAEGDSVDYRTKNSDRDWLWSETTDSHPTRPCNISLSPSRTLTLFSDDSGNIVSALDSVGLGELAESDYITLAEYLNQNFLRLVIKIDEPFTAVDILSRARRFGKLIEVLYDKDCRVEIVSQNSLEEIFREVAFATSLESLGAVGETSDALASPLAIPAVEEAVRSLDRCVSRLRQCRRS